MLLLLLLLPLMKDVLLHRTVVLVLLHLIRIGHHLPKEIVDAVGLLVACSLHIVASSIGIALAQSSLVIEVGRHAIAIAKTGRGMLLLERF